MDDEEFLRQLEAKLSGAGGRLRKSRMLEEFVMGVDANGAEPDDIDSDSDGSVAEREWVRARRAMMCVREIVRTEKSYLKHLAGFFSGEVSLPCLVSSICIDSGFVRMRMACLPFWQSISRG
jgi:hypothetical protein